jgi:hypothetical protein
MHKADLVIIIDGLVVENRGVRKGLPLPQSAQHVGAAVAF